MRAHSRARARAFVFAAGLALATAAPAVAQVPAGAGAGAADQAGVEVHPGVPVDPADYGPGVIETMEEALARDRARSADLPSDPGGRNGMPGSWAVPSRQALSAPRSGELNAHNKWGDLRMGIGFPDVVDLHGVWIGGQADVGVWPPALRAIGYRDGIVTRVTEWFTDIGPRPEWFGIDLRRIDRVVLEARPAIQGSAFYTIDDLAYTRFEDGSRKLVVIDFEDCDPRQKLSGSGYAGLTWEVGDGPYEQGVHAPRVPEAPEPDSQESNGGGGGFLGGGGTLPTLLSDFEAIKKGDHGSSTYPPDTCGAVGPDHYVEVINRVFAVYDKNTGVKLIGMNSQSFLPGSNGDPRVAYDEHSGRFFVMITDFDNQIFLAVSTSSDATGSWFKTNWSFSGCWPDYPTLGVDADGVYVGAYMVGCGSMTLWAVDKAPLVAPSPSLGTVTTFSNLSYEKALQPCVTYGDPGGCYVVSVNSTSNIRVRRVNPPLTNPTLVTLGYVNVGSHSDPPNAPALGSSTPLNTVDDRLMNAVYRDGSIWTAHTVNQSGKAACRWYQLDPSPLGLIQQGTVTDPVFYYFFPGIAVNASGDVVMGFTGSHSGVYAGAYYTGRLTGDTAGEMAIPALFRAGQAAQNNIDGYGRNRWGDYSLSFADPDGERLWMIQEYGHATNIWGTHVAEVKFDGPGCPDPYTYCVASPNSVGPGMTVGYSGSGSVAQQDLTLFATAGPPNQFGLFFYGMYQDNVPFGEGVLCVDGGVLGIFRFGVTQLDVFGDAAYVVDWNAPPVGSGPGQWVDGDQWNVQFWYRDPSGGPAGFNTTDALSLYLCP